MIASGIDVDADPLNVNRQITYQLLVTAEAYEVVTVAMRASLRGGFRFGINLIIVFRLDDISNSIGREVKYIGWRLCTIFKMDS